MESREKYKVGEDPSRTAKKKKVGTIVAIVVSCILALAFCAVLVVVYAMASQRVKPGPKENPDPQYSSFGGSLTIKDGRYPWDDNLINPNSFQYKLVKDAFFMQMKSTIKNMGYGLATSDLSVTGIGGSGEDIAITFNVQASGLLNKTDKEVADYIKRFLNNYWKGFMKIDRSSIQIVHKAICNRHPECKNQPCADVRDGCLVGKYRTLDIGLGDTKVKQFLGIPFAAPPVGGRRFVDPFPVRPWANVLNATKHASACAQILIRRFPATFWPAEMWNAPGDRSEDCLYLNVFAPNDAKDLPVMVWIHGGGLFRGTSSLEVYDGSVLAASQKVIVVSINYRLGMFGFFSTGDGRIKGNFGLKDQNLALRWVQQNIAQFGGNPDSITLFGNSAGAVSIGYHIISPMSKGLFHRAIMQSGVPLALPAMTQLQARRRSELMMTKLNCLQEKQEELLECLSKHETLSIVLNEFVVTKPVPTFTWLPIVDGIYLTKTPNEALADNMLITNGIDIIIGSTKDEGAYFNALLFPQHFKKDNQQNSITMKQFEAVAREYYSDLPKTIQDEIIKNYSLGVTDGNSRTVAANRIIGDRLLTCPILNFANAYPGKMYLYRLDYRSSNEQWPAWMGVVHQSDIQWFFGKPLDKDYNGRRLKLNKIKDYSEAEKKLTVKILNYLGNFAKTGSPNGKGQPEWKPFNPKQTTPSMLRIKSDGTIQGDSLDSAERKRCSPWPDYLNKSSGSTLEVLNKTATCTEYLECRGNDKPCIKTAKGCIRGKTRTVKTRGKKIMVKQFLGLPFAKPPMGTLRYADPLEHEGWKGVRPTTQNGASCMQPTTVFGMEPFGSFWPIGQWNPPGKISEDCLFLNVFTPDGVKNSPVMVFFHYGSFLFGSISIEVNDGTVLAADQNVTVVAMNYRVNSFGFLSTGDGHIKGNFGLKDQLLALQWVKDNIAKFGGNPNDVTIFGGGAGGSSIGFQILSQKSKGLFKRAMMVSGSPTSRGSYMSPAQAKRRSTALFKRFNCTDTDKDKLLACLRALDAKTIIAKDAVITTPQVASWSPTVDGDFIRQSPMTTIKEATFKPDVPLLMGFTKNQGVFFHFFFMPTDFSFKQQKNPITKEVFEKGVRIHMKDFPKAIQDEVIANYTRNITDGNALTEKLDRVNGELLNFDCSMIEFAENYTKPGTNGKVFLYKLHYKPPGNGWPEWVGVEHGADMQWMFGHPFDEEFLARHKADNISYTSEERIFAKNYLDYIGTFAKTGNPNHAGLTKWPQYERPTYQALMFTPDMKTKVVKADEIKTCAPYSRYMAASTCCTLAP